ncbi:MAG: hypothetical protein HY279_10885 [Nitrospinae bacterium]|nr:hypothetical protein [Nitrospinota bacterium]
MNLTPKRDFKVFFAMMGTLIIPAALTLFRVERPGTLVIPADPTPLGYTWSLLLFIIPILTIVAWLYINHDEKFIRKSFWLTIGLLTPIGFLLDILLGSTFFTFLNHNATLQIYLPGYNFSARAWLWNLPVEEFIFYGTGFIAILLFYIWCDEYWLLAYNVPDYRSETKDIKRILVFHPWSVVLGIFLIIIAVIYKKFFPHPYHEGFPGYFTFLVAVSITPSCAFFKTSSRFINWRAFSFTFFFLLLISLMWEATLATPYQWWGYNYKQMLGITVGAWSRLPIEAVMLWMSVTFTTVIIYEVIKIWFNSGKKAMEAFFGIRTKI